jgi:hypothetical protein
MHSISFHAIPNIPLSKQFAFKLSTSQQGTMPSLSSSTTRTTLISSPGSTNTTLLHDIKQEEVDYDTDIDIDTIVKKPAMPRTPYKPRLAHIYAVMVKDNGTILL